jgi:hypothetical protein
LPPNHFWQNENWVAAELGVLVAETVSHESSQAAKHIYSDHDDRVDLGIMGNSHASRVADRREQVLTG